MQLVPFGPCAMPHESQSLLTEKDGKGKEVEKEIQKLKEEEIPKLAEQNTILMRREEDLQAHRQRLNLQIYKLHN